MSPKKILALVSTLDAFLSLALAAVIHAARHEFHDEPRHVLGETPA